MPKIDNEKKLYCSFCKKSQDDVEILITGEDTFICDGCVKLCVQAIYKDGPYKDFIQSILSGSIDFYKLGFSPIFGRRGFKLNKKLCFVLCPFKEPFNTIHIDHIKPSIESLGFSVKRADDIYGVSPIMEDIWEQLNRSSIVIAEVTGKNANVMYEVGIAHTVGKPVVLITQDLNDVPFDLRHYRIIHYEYTPRDCKDLENRLKKTVETIQTSLFSPKYKIGKFIRIKRK